MTARPQSPPWAPNRSYPSRLISSAQARAIRRGPQPGSVGLPLNPNPGSDGHASAAAGPDSSWMPWLDACQRAYENTKIRLDVIFVQLVGLLKSGQIKSLVCTVDLKGGKIRSHELPPTIWEEIGIKSAQVMQTILPKWVKKKRAEGLLPDWWPEGSPQIYLKRSDVDRHWPTAAKPSLAETIEIGRQKPGPKADWKDFVTGELIRIVHFDGVPGNVAAVSRQLGRLCLQKFGKKPNAREIHRHVTQVLGPVRARMAQIRNSS